MRYTKTVVLTTNSNTGAGVLTGVGTMLPQPLYRHLLPLHQLPLLQDLPLLHLLHPLGPPLALVPAL